ncbi:hypothetical protein C0Q70_12747 [Pomacea canaliculata]|uniref:F5/8 type C domain-containing protein n=1 Tax=Pomacea canaliculata TaxID=400727 RepID=A0A2T7P2C8_POMCA|nr:hypothetical protein C0Q70_12747 [Pomacea canaliculata]
MGNDTNELQNFTASSSLPGVVFGPAAALFSREGAWRPSEDDITQFIQIDLGKAYHVTHIVIRGDEAGSYVSLFRLLHSDDNIRWHPYSEDNIVDKFFSGNVDSQTDRTILLTQPLTARYIRLNPLSWENHIALKIDIRGCSSTEGQHLCKVPFPPDKGAVSCEGNVSRQVCTAFCLGNLVFENKGPAIHYSCNEESDEISARGFPPCIGEFTKKNRMMYIISAGSCMFEEIDCLNVASSNYQYCGSCHHFSTCSSGYLYVRACPEQLEYDARKGQCEYRSSTCSTSHVSRRAQMSTIYSSIRLVHWAVTPTTVN